MPSFRLTQEGVQTSDDTGGTYGYLSGNNRALLTYFSYAGDGAGSEMAVNSCGSPPILPLRQKQRDDYFNAPRNRGPHNAPTSRQASLRSSPGSNTYLMERVLEGCGC